MTIAGSVAVVLLSVVVGFQLALALGASLGNAAWGGQHVGVLPTRLRIGSGIAALLIYPFIILVVLESSRLWDVSFLRGSMGTTMWVLCGLFVLGALANVASRSPAERYWAPISIGIAICCAVIASTG